MKEEKIVDLSREGTERSECAVYASVMPRVLARITRTPRYRRLQLRKQRSCGSSQHHGAIRRIHSRAHVIILQVHKA